MAGTLPTQPHHRQPPPRATASNVYTSAAVNRLNHVADWADAPHSTIAFAAHRSIAVWSRPAHTQSTQIHQLIVTPFTKPISSLKFSAPPPPHDHANHASQQPTPSIVAGAGDGAFAVWKHRPSIDAPSLAPGWTRTATVSDAHSGSISAIGVLRPTADLSSFAYPSEVIVTGASDGLLKVWTLRTSGDGNDDANDQLDLAQTIDLNGRFPLDVALLPLPASTATSSSSPQPPGKLLMAVATTTRKIDLYAADLASTTAARPTFVHKLALEGHEDWVKSIDFCHTAVSDIIMLASGSQDSSVRLWKIARAATDDDQLDGGDGQRQTASDQPLRADDFEAMVSKIEGDMTKADGEISTKAQYFDAAGGGGDGHAADRWAVTFDALLIGHDNWVTGVRWHPAVPSHKSDSADGVAGPALVQPAALLTSSADNSLILWTPTGTVPAAPPSPAAPTSPFPLFDHSLVSTGGAKRARGPSAHHIASSIWLPSQRFGEVGGASNLGFFGALWKPSGSSADRADGADSEGFEAVMAHGWGGGTHIWRLDAPSSSSSSATGTLPSLLPQWRIANPVTGHFGPAKSVAWEPCGEYLLSCSVDQTTRLHAKPNNEGAASTWHEVARPQSHGYDLHAVSWLDRLAFASAADEKVVRVFAAPRGFVGSVGRRGLACASIGTEDESRLGLRAARGRDRRCLLALCDDAGDLAACTARHGDLMRQLAERVCSGQDGDEGSLTAVVASDRFEDLADNANARRYSFRRLESYLKWMYAQAWAVAVERGKLFVDINVLLVPSSRLGTMLPRLAAASDSVSVDAASIGSLRPALDNARVRFATIAAAKDGGSNEAATAAADASTTTDEDDDADSKGFRTYRVAALGGTFDHLHAGHKILLSMAALVASERLIVGVTSDAMIAKKSNADLLETLPQRRARVDAFLRLFRLAFGPLRQEVVELSDVAGPAGTDADVEALVLTDETRSGAEFIDKMRREKGLRPLDDWVIGVLGSQGETDLRGDAKALAESKVGSTAIRKWIRAQGARRAHALATLLRSRQHQLDRLVASFAPDDAARPGKDGSDASTAGGHDDIGNDGEADLSARPVGASVPPLGLSNRAIFSTDAEGAASIVEEPSASGQPIGSARESLSSVLTRPPTEEQLSVETLWPELDKVYGHGYELLWLSASPALSSSSQGGGRYVASSCRATKAEHAVVRVHDRLQNWKEVGVLAGHESSVSRIRWSGNARFVVSVSKDRSWRVFERVLRQGQTSFIPLTGERAHARIVWDVCFSADAADPHVFATASRDKTVKIWRLLPSPVSPSSNTADNDTDNDTAGSEGEGQGKPYELLSTIKLPVAVTSDQSDDEVTLALASEDGFVRILAICGV
ncbi:related to ELP2 - 29 kDa subunit of elongator and elongating RNA polymerase II holoenzyme [Pseudozyma flocculosa]|uniref:Elongator complex protein 2 n=1 Tax=Pseudozyma flocculosa TaxID=84751 RepID=A0A5C3FBA2_9BASI|nr:related to ELP2 - 29 kDa subunit of elongator and elongating RNA polymerase II holoenzyme [Pseudozyma flocculosa]